MKQLVVVGVMAAAILVVSGLAFASHCPTMIKEANQLISGMDQSSEVVQTAKALVAEADAYHKAGNHAASEKKAEEALSLIK